MVVPASGYHSMPAPDHGSFEEYDRTIRSVDPLKGLASYEQTWRIRSGGCGGCWCWEMGGRLVSLRSWTFAFWEEVCRENYAGNRQGLDLDQSLHPEEPVCMRVFTSLMQWPKQVRLWPNFRMLKFAVDATNPTMAE